MALQSRFASGDMFTLKAFDSLSAILLSVEPSMHGVTADHIPAAGERVLVFFRDLLVALDDSFVNSRMCFQEIEVAEGLFGGMGSEKLTDLRKMAK